MKDWLRQSESEGFNLQDSVHMYEQSIAILNSKTPQSQGLEGDELTEAMKSPGVIKTFVEGPNGETIQIPQLAPLETYPWLNQDFYRSHIPDREVRHFIDLPGVEPGENVKEAILDLASRDGVIVFDYPDSDSDCPERIKQELTDLGVEYSEVEILGTQTYFAGKIRLLEGQNPDLPVLTLAQAFEKLKQSGVGLDQSNGSTFYRHMDPETTEKTYEKYEKAFRKLNEHPCRQGLTTAEFASECVDNLESAKLVYNVDGEPATICILGDDLTKYPWLNPDFYRNMYPEEYETGQIFYFPALYTDPEKQGAANTEHVIQYICKMLASGNSEAIIAFDCCDINVDFLPVFIEMFVNETPEARLKFDTLGKQQYCAIQLFSDR